LGNEYILNILHNKTTNFIPNSKNVKIGAYITCKLPVIPTVVADIFCNAYKINPCPKVEFKNMKECINDLQS